VSRYANGTAEVLFQQSGFGFWSKFVLKTMMKPTSGRKVENVVHKYYQYEA